MISELVQVGDIVSITVEKESRDWGYKPCVNGTLATVLGFNTITYARINGCGVPPGVYWNKSWCKIKLHDESGREYTEYSGRFTLVDPVVTYNDAELGERVRLHTLKGFGLRP